MFRRTFAEINIDHLEHNILQLRQHMGPQQFFCPMVKANAYGHGDSVLSQIFQKMQVPALGVCLIEEGLLIRQFGVKTQVLVFRGFDRRGAQEMLEHNLTPVVSDWLQLEAWQSVVSPLKESLKDPIPIHLKFDTGMNRLGFSISEAKQVAEYLLDKKYIQVQGILTHLYEGESALDSNGSAHHQLESFLTLKKFFTDSKIIFHALNSGGFICQVNAKMQGLKNTLTNENWGVRPGLMIYGYNPVAQDHIFSLKPVMSLKSHVNVFRHVTAGQGVSYNHTWKAKKNSRIAVVPLGYADGFHRILSNQGFVLFQNQRVPIIGNICMDYLMLDVTDVFSENAPLTHEEKEVTFFGYDNQGQLISALEQAQKAQTITWEILTSVGERVPRVYKSTKPDWQEFL